VSIRLANQDDKEMRNVPISDVPISLARLMAAAPHRMLFLVGAANVLAAMGWWAWWLVMARWHPAEAVQPPLPAGWMHAILMQYHVLPPFIFGFLLTVFPRWLSLRALTPRHYLPVGVGLLGGQVLTLAGLAGSLPLLRAGALFTLAGWLVGMTLLARLVLRAGGRPWHALSCLLALGFGLVGLTFHALLTLRADAQVAFVAIKLGGIPMLLPIYFTVCHRMIPFFTQAFLSQAGLPIRAMPRPYWVLATAWALLVAHLALELRHAYPWLWIADAPLALLFTGLLIAWWPQQRVPALLRVLYLGFAWLPLAFALYAWQSAFYAISGEFLLGRAPAHAMFIGFFGSMLVAMVTRVTQGHSGRPLVLGAAAGVAFVIVQLVAVTRIVAELVPDALAWQAIAALGWLVAFLPWVLRSAWIYLTPRADGQPG
jgi:uncharacterized protein involved in response to NO